MKPPRTWVVHADRASLAGMALGIALLLLPAGGALFRLGFFVVLGSTLAQILFSHLDRERA